MQSLADCKPQTGLAPPANRTERYRLPEWLNNVATELHKAFAPLFDPTSTDAMKRRQRTMLQRQFTYLNKVRTNAPS